MNLDDEEILEELNAENDSRPHNLMILFVAIMVVVFVIVTVFWIVLQKDDDTSAMINDQKSTLESVSGQESPTGTEETSEQEETVETSSMPEESSMAEEASVSEEASEEVPESSQEPSDPYASFDFYDVDEQVTAKEATNLRDVPSQGEESTVMAVLQNGEVAQRIAVSDKGWSRLIYNGEEYYAVSTLLTTDLKYHVEEEVDDGIKTVFTPCDDKVSPKIEVNLRRLPSVTNENATVVVTLPYGEVVTRTGINTDLGWSRVEYNGEVLYCISSYVYVVE